MRTIYTFLAPQNAHHMRHKKYNMQMHTTDTARYTCTQVARGVQQRATATKHDQTCFSAGLCFWLFLKHLVHVCNHKHRWQGWRKEQLHICRTLWRSNHEEPFPPTTTTTSAAVTAVNSEIEIINTRQLRPPNLDILWKLMIIAIQKWIRNTNTKTKTNTKTMTKTLRE